MNQFTLLVIVLVVFTYYGGSNVPKVLKDNKELLLGVVGGLVLCSFLGMRLEGITGGNDDCEELFVLGSPYSKDQCIGNDDIKGAGVWRNGKCCKRN